MATSGKDTKLAKDKPATRQTPTIDDGAARMISEGDVTGLPEENDFNPYDEVRPRANPRQPERSTPDRSGSTDS